MGGASAAFQRALSRRDRSEPTRHQRATQMRRPRHPSCRCARQGRTFSEQWRPVRQPTVSSDPAAPGPSPTAGRRACDPASRDHRLQHDLVRDHAQHPCRAPANLRRRLRIRDHLVRARPPQDIRHRPDRQGPRHHRRDRNSAAPYSRPTIRASEPLSTAVTTPPRQLPKPVAGWATSTRTRSHPTQDNAGHTGALQPPARCGRDTPSAPGGRSIWFTTSGCSTARGESRDPKDLPMSTGLDRLGYSAAPWAFSLRLACSGENYWRRSATRLLQLAG